MASDEAYESNPGALAARYDLVEDRLPNDSPAWRELLRLDAAVCKHFFTPENAGHPVYLDVEIEALASCGGSLGLSGNEYRDELVGAVRDLLFLKDDSVNLFNRFHVANINWFRQLIEARRTPGTSVPPPPTIGLLATLVLPAEQMGSDGGRGGAHQRYYPPLMELLGVPSDLEARFRSHYSKVCENLWRGLNAWLESEGGVYGLPTAFALSHRYVGLPVSQALIRETERRQLRRVFSQYGLQAGETVSETEMHDLLEDWITQAGSPASKQLKRLWKQSDNQTQLSSIAVNELASWDGTGFSDGSQSSQRTESRNRCRIFLFEKSTNFLSPEISIGISIRTGPTSTDKELVIETTEGAVPVFAETLKDGLASLNSNDFTLDGDSLLRGKISVRQGDQTSIRLPRDLVPLKFDELAGIWIEVDSVELGETYRILLADSFYSSGLEVLQQCAQGPFKKLQIPGLPDGWSLISDLRIVTLPSLEVMASEDFQLSGIRARPAKRMVLDGGLRLPGQIVRYSSKAVPLLTVVSDEDVELTVSIGKNDVFEENGTPMETITSRPPFTVTLDEVLEEDGDYQILLEAGKEALQSLSLRLRSSSEPDAQGWSRFQDLAHGDPDHLWPSRAIPTTALEAIRCHGILSFGDPYEMGAVTATSVGALPDATPPSTDRPLVLVPGVSDDSCIITGAHKIQLPPFDYTEKKKGWVVGTCDSCGLQKRHPANHKFAAFLSMRNKVTPDPKKEQTSSPRLAEVRPANLVQDGGVTSIPLEAAVDAVVYIGQGPLTALRRISRQVDNNAIFSHSFTKALHQLGVIELEVDDFGNASGFEIAPTAITSSSDGALVLGGAWTEITRTNLMSAVQNMGGEWSPYVTEGFTIDSIEGIELEDLRDVLADIDENISLIDRAGVALIERLPPLSTVGAHLHRIPYLGANRSKVFLSNEGRWADADEGANWVGTYANFGFATNYYFRSEQDLKDGTAAIADVYFAKHLGTQSQGRVLADYSESESEISVPLGCDLPGLYGRAAVLESGLLPSQRGEHLVYQGISEYFAEILLSKLAA